MPVPRNYSTPEIISIQPVLDFALNYNPILATKDIGTITYWMAAGCTIEDDILPVMKRICEFKKGISSFNYFTKPVTQQRDVRLAKKAYDERKPVDLSQHIDKLKWKLKMGMALTEEQEKMLIAHENKKAPSF